jgi:hypothetical protein
MILVTCACKKQFVVDIPVTEFSIDGAPEKTFLVAKCPVCKMLTKFQPAETKEIEEGKYVGRLEMR